MQLFASFVGPKLTSSMLSVLISGELCWLLQIVADLIILLCFVVAQAKQSSKADVSEGQMALGSGKFLGDRQMALFLALFLCLLRCGLVFQGMDRC